MEDCVDYFSGCTFNVADIGLIIAYHGSGTFTDQTVVNSGRFGVIMHSGTGGGTLLIDKGSEFNTKSTVIQVKGRGTSIVVDNAKLNSSSGVILQTMENDDPFMSGGGPRGGSGTSGGPGAARAGSDQGAAPANDRGGAPGGRAPVSRPTFSGDVNATLKNVTLNGDIIHSMTTRGDMIITMENAIISGAITTATAKHALGPNGEELTMQHPELYYLIGEVENTYCATGDKYGLKVSLDGKSTWVVDKTSYLTSLTLPQGATIKAPEGYSVTMTVDGIETAIKAGNYIGKIVLTIAKTA